MKLVASLVLFWVPLAAMANPNNVIFECTHGKAKRTIEIAYETDAAVPCAVNYTKSEGTKTLWSAQNNEGYCEAKAEAFVDKQSSWGWDCKQLDNQQVSPN